MCKVSEDHGVFVDSYGVALVYEIMTMRMESGVQDSWSGIDNKA